MRCSPTMGALTGSDGCRGYAGNWATTGTRSRSGLEISPGMRRGCPKGQRNRRTPSSPRWAGPPRSGSRVTGWSSATRPALSRWRSAPTSASAIINSGAPAPDERGRLPVTTVPTCMHGTWKEFDLVVLRDVEGYVGKVEQVVTHGPGEGPAPRSPPLRGQGPLVPGDHARRGRAAALRDAAGPARGPGRGEPRGVPGPAALRVGAGRPTDLADADVSVQRASRNVRLAIAILVTVVPDVAALIRGASGCRARGAAVTSSIFRPTAPGHGNQDRAPAHRRCLHRLRGVPQDRWPLASSRVPRDAAPQDVERAPGALIPASPQADLRRDAMEERTNVREGTPQGRRRGHRRQLAHQGSAHRSVEDQARPPETARHLADMVEAGWELAIGHGNGPQVGFILRRSEIAAQGRRDARGASGRLRGRHAGGHRLRAAAGAAERAVPPRDPQERRHRRDAGARRPRRPGVLQPHQADRRLIDAAEAAPRARPMGWSVMEDAGRGWRRVVASPCPRRSSSSTP